MKILQSASRQKRGKVQKFIVVIKAFVFPISILKAFFCPGHSGIEPLKCIRISELGRALRTFIKWQYPPHITFNIQNIKWDEKDCEKCQIEHIRVEGSNNTSGDMSAGLAAWLSEEE